MGTPKGQIDIYFLFNILKKGGKMNIFNSIKLFIITFLCITHFTANHCMLSKFTYKPITQQPDTFTTQHRDHVEKWVKFAEKGTLNPIKGISIVRDATKKEQEERCFNHAISQITGNTIPLTLYKKNNDKKKSTINIEKYFKQTVDLQKNDLVLYTDNENSYAINHCAVVIDTDENIFESKLGQSRKIVHHQPFAVPNCYGNAISYWTLKDKYQRDKERLKKTIRDDADAFNNGQQSYKKQKVNHYL